MGGNNANTSADTGRSEASKAPRAVAAPKAVDDPAGHTDPSESKALNAAATWDHFSERLEGEALAEGYERVGEPIGEGTYGTVWKARCKATGQLVAMKKLILRNEREGFPVSSIRELRALRRLQHPNVVTLVDVCVEPPAPGTGHAGDCYIVFEYAPSDLTGLLVYRKRLKPPEIKCLIKQLANALDYCHLLGIMHRDLKPSNILITGDGDLKLCDFGLSRTFDGPGTYSTRVITLWYRPPELLLGTTEYGSGVDLWSAGCIFGEMLAGYPLFAESTEIKVFRKIVERTRAQQEDAWPEKIRRLPQWDALFPRKLDNLGQDIYKDIAARHGSAAEDFVKACLALDPTERIDAEGVLAHPFLGKEPLACLPQEIKINPHMSCHELDVKRHREKVREEKEAQRQQKRAAPQGESEPAEKKAR